MHRARRGTARATPRSARATPRARAVAPGESDAPARCGPANTPRCRGRAPPRGLGAHEHVRRAAEVAPPRGLGAHEHVRRAAEVEHHRGPPRGSGPTNMSAALSRSRGADEHVRRATEVAWGRRTCPSRYRGRAPPRGLEADERVRRAAEVERHRGAAAEIASDDMSAALPRSRATAGPWDRAAAGVEADEHVLPRCEVEHHRGPPRPTTRRTGSATCTEATATSSAASQTWTTRSSASPRSERLAVPGHARAAPPVSTCLHAVVRGPRARPVQHRRREAQGLCVDCQARTSASSVVALSPTVA